MKSGISKDRIYLFSLPKEFTGGAETPKDYKTVDQLIAEGKCLPELEALRWEKGQGARQTAFLCYSSGTSGLPVQSRVSTSHATANANGCSTERCYDFTP